MQQARSDKAFDAIILGAGAAGMMCAAVAGQRGRRVLLVDHADAPGKKILISGGGRCNFTNIHTAPDRYLSANPHFAKSALRRYTPRGLPRPGRAPPHRLARKDARPAVLRRLGAADRRNAAGRMRQGRRCDVALGQSGRARSTMRDGRFRVALGDANVAAPALVIATGGPSIPKLGATGFAYDLARRFGLKMVEPRPGAGAADARRRGGAVPRAVGGRRPRSSPAPARRAFAKPPCSRIAACPGPAILQISSYWRPRRDDRDRLPARRGARAGCVAAKRERPRAHFDSVLGASCFRRGSPRRWPSGSASAASSANVADRRLEEAEQRLARWRFRPNGTEGFAKAEVTAGGIATAGLSSQTMEAQAVPGLYAIGEAVDVTGWLGGYNFQWAWASGWAAGQAL